MIKYTIFDFCWRIVYKYWLSSKLIICNRWKNIQYVSPMLEFLRDEFWGQHYSWCLFMIFLKCPIKNMDICRWYHSLFQSCSLSITMENVLLVLAGLVPPKRVTVRCSVIRTILLCAQLHFINLLFFFTWWQPLGTPSLMNAFH